MLNTHSSHVDEGLVPDRLLVAPPILLTQYRAAFGSLCSRSVTLAHGTLTLSTEAAPELSPIAWKNETLASLANMATVKFQLRKLSLGMKTDPKVSPLRALILQQTADACRTRKYRRLMAQRVPHH